MRESVVLTQANMPKTTAKLDKCKKAAVLTDRYSVPLALAAMATPIAAKRTQFLLKTDGSKTSPLKFSLTAWPVTGVAANILTQGLTEDSAREGLHIVHSNLFRWAGHGLQLNTKYRLV